MDRKYAKEISQLLASATNAAGSKYKLKEYINRKKLAGFHHWADARPCEGAYLFADQADNGLWVLLLDWREQDNFYVVLFPESKSGPVAEIHRLTVKSGEEVLHWRYSPSKRDGKNEERKAYFVEAFLSDNVQISVPKNLDDVDDFIEELFSLASSRAKADELDPNRPNVRSGFPEGKLKERLHLSRERNRELVRQAKLLGQSRDGHLKCACCGFDFFATYGEVGKGFIEAHHTNPVSTLHENGEETKIEDLALVCSNCHRMLHRKRPWLEMNDLAKLLTANLTFERDRPEAACPSI
ncbi:MAG: HNH endonuclease [Proteobacteria bacterium]|nr:HNH endonuclease [Pseudomonadota bacterium]